MNRVLPNYESGGPFPQRFDFDMYCPVNEQAQLIPDPDLWETVPMAPTTLKHQYSPIPMNYPEMKITRPKGTLYDQNFVETYPTGMGRRKIIGGGHYKVYPLTNRHVIESRVYTDYYFPRPKWSTEYRNELVTTPNHVRTDGWL